MKNIIWWLSVWARDSYHTAMETDFGIKMEWVIRFYNIVGFIVVLPILLTYFLFVFLFAPFKSLYHIVKNPDVAKVLYGKDKSEKLQKFSKKINKVLKVRKIIPPNV